jgi:phosphatidylethanolamine-binding protein (PEBP) family uncharacterized protein
MVWRASGHKKLCRHLLRSRRAGSGFWHWLVVNIPATVGELAEGAGSTGGKLPAGALQTRTDVGSPSYGGPCMCPSGERHHKFELASLRLMDRQCIGHQGPRTVLKEFAAPTGRKLRDV